MQDATQAEKKKKKGSAAQDESTDSDGDRLQDVATPASAFALMRGLFSGLLGLAIVGSGLVLVILPIKSAPSANDPPAAVLIGAGVFVTAIGWLFLSGAVRKLIGAFQSGRYFRVGPNRIRVRVPGDATWSSLRFGYSMLEIDMSWDDVKSWYPLVHRVNGIPMESEIVFEQVRGGEYRIPTWHFAESRTAIARRISQASGRGST
jgi:hypothetical protein